MPIPVAPILAGAYIAASAGASVYSSYKNIQYQKAYMAENARYWKDYEKRTGLKPRYPYRAGSVYNTNSLYNSYSSLVRSWTPLVGFGYGQVGRRSNEYRPNKNYTDWMYA